MPCGNATKRAASLGPRIAGTVRRGVNPAKSFAEWGGTFSRYFPLARESPDRGVWVPPPPASTNGSLLPSAGHTPQSLVKRRGFPLASTQRRPARCRRRSAFRGSFVSRRISDFRETATQSVSNADSNRVASGFSEGCLRRVSNTVCRTEGCGPPRKLIKSVSAERHRGSSRKPVPVEEHRILDRRAARLSRAVVSEKCELQNWACTRQKVRKFLRRILERRRQVQLSQRILRSMLVFERGSAVSPASFRRRVEPLLTLDGSRHLSVQLSGGAQFLSRTLSLSPKASFA